MSEAECPLTLASFTRGGSTVTGVKWLLPTGASVREDQPIAEVSVLPAGVSAANTSSVRAMTQQLRAPVTGKLVRLQNVAGAGAGAIIDASAPVGLLRVCTHSMLFNRSLCGMCGADVTRLPRGTKAFLERLHANKQPAAASGTSAGASSSGAAPVGKIAPSSALSTATGKAGAANAIGSGAVVASVVQSVALAHTETSTSGSSSSGQFGAAMRGVRVQHGYELSLTGGCCCVEPCCLHTVLHNFCARGCLCQQ